MNSHPRDQWFRIYVYTPWSPKIEIRNGTPYVVLDAKGNPVMVPPTWKLEEGPVHVHHPDGYHPDPRVCQTHHRENRRVAIAACGLRYSPENRFVETHDPEERCAECVASTKSARLSHLAYSEKKE